MSSPRYNEARVTNSAARLQVRRFRFLEPATDVVYDEDNCYFHTYLNSHHARAWGNYRDRFSPSDSERIGRAIFVPAGTALRMWTEAQQPWMLQCWFHAESFDALDVSWDRAQLRQALDIRSPALECAAQRLAMELSEPGFASDVVIDALCTTMMVDVARYFQAPPTRVKVRGGLPAWRLRQIEERVRQTGAPPTMEELAGLCALSPRHLMRAFRQQTGQSIGTYIEQVRSERAKAMLAANDVRLKDVAEALGFSEVSAFSHAFQRVTGERPSVYRAKARAGARGAFVSLSR